MMKKTKWLCVLLAFVTAFAFVGCNKTPTPETPTKPNTVDVAVTVGEVTDLPKATAEYTVADPSIAACNGQSVIGFKAGQTTVTADDVVYNVTVADNELGTTHVYDVRQTNIKLVENGKSDYVLVIPKDETDEMITESAPNEFNDLFKTATGLTLTVLTDDRVPETTTGKYFFIGDTRQAKAAGITAERETYGQNGFRLVTVGQSVYGVGGGRFGTLYTVYEFMKWQFHYEQYAMKAFVIDKNVTNCNLLDFNISDIPDFNFRMGNYYTWNTPMDDLSPERMRVQRVDEVWIKFGGEFVHNSLLGITPAKYRAEHPDWFSPNTTWMQQLCLTRDVEGLSDEVVKIMGELIEANPTLSTMSFTQQDTPYWCDCPSCAAMKDEYGVNAASNIKFINVVAQKLRAWLNENHPDRQIQLAIFAYLEVEDAPAIRNAETGKYEPIDDSVILDPMVSIFYAPIYAKYYCTYEEDCNRRFVENMDKWKACASSMYLWTYSTCFGYYLMPYDSFNATEYKFEYAYKSNALYLFDQGQHNQPNSTDFGALKAYINSKMMWNVQYRMNDLVDAFMQGYYMEAGDAVKKYYDNYRTWFGYAMDAFGYHGDIGDTRLNTRFFPEKVLRDWLGYLDEAYAAIEPIKATEPERYEELYGRILTETISIRFCHLYLYGNSYTAEGLRAAVDTFMEDCYRVGTTLYNEWQGIEYFRSVMHERYPNVL